MTGEMKKREDALRKIVESLNRFDACSERLQSMQLCAECIKHEYKALCEQMGVY